MAKTKKKSSASAKKKPNRKMVVFSSLVGCLTLTGGLLVALAPSPLSPDAPASLSAVAGTDTLSSIYATRTPVSLGRWTAVYVHHSGSQVAPTSQSDHFLIHPDGQIQFTPRWSNQSSAAAPAGAASIDPACVSICLVGDLDQNAPTAAQVTHLTQLIQSLQSRLGLPARSVLTLHQPGSPAAVGRLFPTTDFRNQLLR